MGRRPTHSALWVQDALYIDSYLYQRLDGHREWQDWLDHCRYRLAPWWLAWLLRRWPFYASAITLAGTAYMLPETWYGLPEAGDEAGLLAICVHEAIHARDEQQAGWWRFAARYAWWRVTHLRTPIREHPLEREAYRVQDEVGALLNG